MLETLSFDEYIRWLAYFSVEPFPEDRADIRNAQLIHAIYSMLGGKSKVSDHIPNYWENIEQNAKQTPDEVVEKLRLLALFSNNKGKEEN